MYLSAGTNTVSVEVKDSTITNFDKEGINAEGNKLTVNIHHNTITGRGPISDEVQNGVDIGRDAAGTVSYNTISNLEYGPKTWWAAGIMFYSYVSPTGKSATAIGNTITNCQIGIMFKNVNGSAQGNTVSGGTVGLCGIGAEPNASGATTASFVNNTVSGISGTGHYAIGANTYISVSPGATLTATIDGNQLTGGGSTDADGIIIGDSAGTVATVAATITNNTISGWKSGICLKAVSANAASSSAHNNNIINNQTYGVSNAGTGSLNAEYNWWGTAVDSEIAAMVSGSVDYTPFLTTAPSSVCMTANGQEATPPAVATSDASAIAFTLATLNGDLTAVGSSVGGPQVSFVYGTTSVPSPTGEHGGYSNETAQSQKGTTGAFNANLTTLTAGLTYYFRAKAQPSDMIDPVYGNEKSFTTAKITTLAATSVGVTTATLNGHLDIGSATSVDVYLAYDTTSHSGSPTAYTWNAAVPATLTASGDFSKNVTGLTANTPYYFMAKGAVGADLNYGAEKDFTTLHRIGISVSPTTINFGDIVAGHSSASQTVTVTNTGTPKEKFTTTLANQSPADFYTSNLKIDTTYTAATWSATSVAVGGTATPGLVLSIPIGTAAGAKTGTLIFWAELVP
jgi:hypothetical protein